MRLIFILWVIAELLVFVVVADLIGFFGAILLIVLSMLLGGSLMRWQGVENLRKVHERAARREPPQTTMIHAAAIVMGGLLMVIPGFITSVLGIVLLLPWCRDRLARWLLSQGLMSNRFTAGKHAEQGRVIDADYWQQK